MSRGVFRVEIFLNSFFNLFVEGVNEWGGGGYLKGEMF
jgi:hypothetical protein